MATQSSLTGTERTDGGERGRERGGQSKREGEIEREREDVERGEIER